MRSRPVIALASSADKEPTCSGAHLNRRVKSLVQTRLGCSSMNTFAGPCQEPASTPFPDFQYITKSPTEKFTRSGLDLACSARLRVAQWSARLWQPLGGPSVIESDFPQWIHFPGQENWRCPGTLLASVGENWWHYR